MSRRRIFDSLRQSLEPRPEAVVWVTLAEAATAFRLAQRDSDRDRMARALGETEDSVLAFWAHQVIEAGVAVHGCRIGSDKRETIPGDVLRTGVIRDGATRIEIVRRDPMKDFCDLQVRRADLDQALARAPGTRRP